MELTFSASHTTLTDAIKSYAEKRLSRLDRRFREPVSIHLKVRKEETRRQDDRFIAEVTIPLKRGVIRGEERADSPYSAIDLVQEKVDRQIRRYKTRFERRRREAPGGLGAFIAEQLAADEAPLLNAAGDEAEVAVAEAPEVVNGRLVRTKTHEVVPISVEDAVEQMDLLGHHFYVFQNAESGRINVVYRRKDDNYGLIVPEPVEAG